MAADITTLNATMLEQVKATNNLNQTIQRVFPQTIGTVGSATGGAATLPANPVGFLSVIEPSTGATVLIPYYSA